MPKLTHIIHRENIPWLGKASNVSSLDIQNAALHTEMLLLSLFKLLLSINTLEEIDDLRVQGRRKPVNGQEHWCLPRALHFISQIVPSLRQTASKLEPEARKTLQVQFHPVEFSAIDYTHPYATTSTTFSFDYRYPHRLGWIRFRFLIAVIKQCIDLRILLLGSDLPPDDSETKLKRTLEWLRQSSKVLGRYEDACSIVVTPFGFNGAVMAPGLSMFEQRRRAGIADPAQMGLTDCVIEAMMRDIREALINAFGGIEKVEGRKYLWSSEVEPLSGSKLRGWRSSLGEIKTRIVKKSVGTWGSGSKKRQKEKSAVEVIETVKKVEMQLECVGVMKTRLDWIALLRFLESLRAESVLARIQKYLDED